MVRLGDPGERFAVCQDDSWHCITVMNLLESSGFRKLIFLSVWRELPLLRENSC